MRKYKIRILNNGQTKSVFHEWGNSDAELTRQAFDREAKKTFGDGATAEILAVEEEPA